MSAVHQFVPMLHRGDAVGEHTLAIAERLRRAGVASEIYVELDDPETVELTRPASRYPAEARAGDLLVYQLATASAMAAWLAARPERLVVNYHNITPPELFSPWDTGLVHHQLRAQSELAQLARRAVLGVAVSEVNRADLVRAGFAATAVVPPVVELPPPTTEAGDRPRQLGARWLTVGRLAPNKAVHDTMAGLLAYRRLYDPEATLTVVGRPAVATYVRALHRYVADLGLVDAVTFAGRVDARGLAEAYDQADVVVVTSEHEGFCLPLVEAMVHGVPVVAFSEGAVPDVVGSAGLLLERKDPLALAEAVGRVQHDPELRASLVAAGAERPGQLGLAEAGERMVEVLLGARPT